MDDDADPAATLERVVAFELATILAGALFLGTLLLLIPGP